MNGSRLGNRKGQSIVEYLIVAVAVIGALVAFKGSIDAGITQVGKDAETAMTNAGSELAGLSPEAQ